MYAVAAVLHDQLYAVAFNQSQLLLLSPPRSVGFSDWSVTILVLSCHYALAVLFQHTIVVCTVDGTVAMCIASHKALVRSASRAVFAMPVALTCGTPCPISTTQL